MDDMDRGGDIQIRIESVDACDVNVVAIENGVASSDSTSADCDREESSDVFEELSPKRTEVCRRKSIIRDPGRKSIGANRKTVSFGSLPTELTVRSAKDCLKHMYSGGQLVKVRSASRVYRRFYWLDEDKCELRWEPSKKDSDKARVKLDDIHEVRSGKNSEVFLSVDTAEHFPEECAFSIVYGDDYNTLDLVAATTEEANIWCTGLRHLVSGKSAGENDMGTAKEAREKWLCEMFKSADINSDGFMDEKESVELITTLSDGVRDNVIKTKLHEYLRNKKQEEGESENGSLVGLTQTEFVELFKDVATRPEVYFILVRYASHEDAMSIDDLRSFLEIEQGLCATREICKDIIEESEPSQQLREKEMLGIDGFTRYLSCDRCTLFNPEKRTPTQDMDKPFTQYFISASHNTYLIQDQLSGRTSLACFTTALEKGCRCLSMDLWSVIDNNNERILTVHHPRNNRLQVRLTAEAVFDTIKENAFTKTLYPLIMVIRVRADESAQHLLVRLLMDTFGELLCHGADCPAEPTPNNLSNKILLEISGRSQEDFSLGSQPGLPIATPLIKRLSNLNFFTPEIVTGIPQGKDQLELSVMPETVASRVATSNAELLVQAGETQLIRVEPNDSRVDCSNYNPLDVWNMGVQMAALHFQTPGLMMDLNEGMFAANGGCGYALKPSIMIDSDITYDSAGKLQPNSVINRNQHEVTTLHLRIISGTDLPKPRGAGSKGLVIDPYVLIEVFGAAADCAEHRTRTVHNCGRNPVFDESCEFRLTVPDMALIRFVILDDDFIGDEFIGQYTIAHSCLLPGYRVLKLHGIFGEELPGASLLVHIAISSSRETSRKKTMLRRRPSRVVSKLRSVGVKSADELYKSVNMHVRESGELRVHHETTTRELKEACGLQPVSNIKQVMRHLASRKMPIKFFIIEGLISIKVDISTLPEHSRKPYSAIESFVSHCRKLIQNGPILLKQIEQVHAEAILLSETIQSLGSVDGLKSKKAAKVHENHAWNCRLLRGQIELLKNSIVLATTQLTQIIECGIQYSMIQGLLADDWRESIACPNFRNDRVMDKRSIPASKYSPNKFSLRGLQRTLSADSSSTVRSFIPKTFKRVSKSESSKEA